MIGHYMPIILTLFIKMLSKTCIICKSYVKTGTLISYNSLINDQSIKKFTQKILNVKMLSNNY